MAPNSKIRKESRPWLQGQKNICKDKSANLTFKKRKRNYVLVCNFFILIPHLDQNPKSSTDMHPTQ